jgi:hypothetical protein
MPERIRQVNLRITLNHSCLVFVTSSGVKTSGNLSTLKFFPCSVRISHQAPLELFPPPLSSGRSPRETHDLQRKDPQA